MANELFDHGATGSASVQAYLYGMNGQSSHCAHQGHCTCKGEPTAWSPPPSPTKAHIWMQRLICSQPLPGHPGSGP